MPSNVHYCAIAATALVAATAIVALLAGFLLLKLSH
jgi:hypothetical protein